MKRLATLLLAVALATLILQPVSITINTPFGNTGQRAEGVPAPPFPPQIDVPGGRSVDAALPA
jgi:hypothetical protein